MEKKDKIKIMFEFPSKWVNYEEPLFGLGQILHTKVEDLLKEKVIDILLEKMELPKITIKPEEIKNRMLDKLAEKALEGHTGEE